MPLHGTMLSAELEQRLADKAVCVHASMRSFGSARVDADVLLDMLLALGCTVVVPTFTYDLEQPPPMGVRPERNGWDYDEWMPEAHDGRFDPNDNLISLRDMGAFPAALLRRPDRVRGNHPVDSFSALGPRAAEIIGTQEPMRVYGPLEKVCDGGVVLLVGVDYTSLTLLHYAEQRAGRSLFQRWAKDKDGSLITCEVGGCSTGFNRFEGILPHYDELVGACRFRLLDAGACVDAAAAAVRANPEITRCENSECERCRDAVLGGPLLT